LKRSPGCWESWLLLDVSLAQGQAGPTSLAVDEASVYWINQDDATLMKLAKP
jgi:hypothetical protein